MKSRSLTALDSLASVVRSEMRAIGISSSPPTMVTLSTFCAPPRKRATTALIFRTTSFAAADRTGACVPGRLRGANGGVTVDLQDGDLEIGMRGHESVQPGEQSVATV